MRNNEALRLFENQHIRTIWNSEEEEWYFSIVDVVSILTEQPDTRHAAKYWSVLKNRMKKEGSELTTNCRQLKLKSADGKSYKTDVANTEQLLRLIQSIPSKKAEPLKLWLAHVGRERIDETVNPELLAERMIAAYEARGYSREWINQRLLSIKVRKSLTDEWQDRGIRKGKEYALLTDELTSAMGRHDDTTIQRLQEPQERKSARQHEPDRACIKHACRNSNKRYFSGREARRF